MEHNVHTYICTSNLVLVSYCLLNLKRNPNLRVREAIAGFARVEVPFPVCCVLGGGPKSVGDILKLRTSRFLAAPEKKNKLLLCLGLNLLRNVEKR